MEPTPPAVKRQSPLLARLATPKVLLGIFAGCAVLVAVPVIAYAALTVGQPARPATALAPAGPSSEPSAVPSVAPASGMKGFLGQLTAVSGDRLTIHLKKGPVTLLLSPGTPVFDVTETGALSRAGAAQLQPGETLMARGVTVQADGTYQARSILFGTAAGFQALQAQHGRPAPSPLPTAGV